MAQSAALRPIDRPAIRKLAARLHETGRHKPILLTGRTAKAAAEALLGELRSEIYRVDLSAVVSKFIGETEKNLRRVFDEADAHGSTVLLFDEADALFGKRTEVKDAHDRFTNAAISDLLERIEARRGLVMLVSVSHRVLPAALRVRLSIHAFPPGRRRPASAKTQRTGKIGA
jgi:SpoVK/Ycf46/Vps4 family AAA+-type ATPase